MRHNLKLALKVLRSTQPGLWRGCALLSFVLCGCVAAAAQNTDNVALSSVNSAGDHAGNGRSSAPRASADGRFVVFQSGASDLVAGDAGATSDVFLRDLQQNTTTLVSVNSTGSGPGAGNSFGASVTPDGRYVVFTSQADDLVTGPC